MPYSIKLRRRSSTRSLPQDSSEYSTLSVIQDQLLSIYTENTNIFDESDVQKIILSKIYLQRFAERRDGNVEKTVEMVKNTLIWRKEQKIPQITIEIVPKEFFDFGACFQQGTDHDGNYVMHVRAKYVFFNEKVKVGMERIFAFIMFSIIEESMAIGKGWTLCADLTGITLAQYDLPEILWVLKVVVNYMPAGIKAVLVHNLPWFAKPFVKLVFAFVPSEWTRIIHFVDYKGLLKYIPQENLPPFYENPKVKYTPQPPVEFKSFDDIDMTPLEIEKKDIMDFFHNIVMKVN